MAVKVVRGLGLASKLFAPGFSSIAGLFCIGGFEVFKLGASLQLVDDVNGRVALHACDDYDAVDTSSHRGHGPADVVGLFVDGFAAWISPPSAFIRLVRGRTR
ncbi:hypothetical protein NCS52_00720500 [Fusarium sp. LHS14.1]|nr:hypothetical protein NCS52_00720500 [Fusarium sp. LHS14.1]